MTERMAVVLTRAQVAGSLQGHFLERFPNYICVVIKTLNTIHKAILYHILALKTKRMWYFTIPAEWILCWILSHFIEYNMYAHV